jgi:hypothetical protein
MRKKDKKEQVIQLRGNVKEVLRNYDLEMKLVHKVPRSFYSSEGTLKQSGKPQ